MNTDGDTDTKMVNSIQLLRIGLTLEIIGALLLAVDLFTDQYQDRIESAVATIMIVPTFLAAAVINIFYLLILFGGLYGLAAQFTSADISLNFFVKTQIFDEYFFVVMRWFGMDSVSKNIN